MTHLSSVKWRVNQPHVVHEILDGEVVLINMDTGSYYSLDGVGADVWTLIEMGAATDEIVRDIGQRYDGAHPELEHTVVGLVDDLRQEGLIIADETRAVKQIAVSIERDDTGSERPRFKAPVLRKYTDMQELISLDPIHQVDDTGWPNRELGRATAD